MVNGFTILELNTVETEENPQKENWTLLEIFHTQFWRSHVVAMKTKKLSK